MASKSMSVTGVDLEALLGVGGVKPARRKAVGRTVRHEVGRMNRLEAAYAGHLAAEVAAGRVLWFAFESIKFRLADRTTYEPDFVVLLSDGSVELHEVKGHWEDDARVKWKAAGEVYFMFHLVAVTRPRGGAWQFERYGRG